MPELGDYHWELYNIAKDFSRTTTSRRQQPDKLKEMQALFLTEAENTMSSLGQLRLCALSRPSRVQSPGKPSLPYTGENAGIPVGNAPAFWTKTTPSPPRLPYLKAALRNDRDTRPGRFGGYGLYC